MTRPTIICLTPVKNEFWILDRFLKCASLWADCIIVADQNSDDKSAELARSFKKVILIKNSNPDYNEYERQKLLIETARQIPPPRLFIALDADEILTSNFITSPEWQNVLKAPQGTVIRFQWANICPDMRHYWASLSGMPLGFIDDGSTHQGMPIHSARIPLPVAAPTIKLRDVKVMHYQYTDWERMRSKHRWYMAWERIRSPQEKAGSLYRQYHHMDAIRKDEMQQIPDEWFREYMIRGIDMTTVFRERTYRWDNEVLNLLSTHGAELFARDQIWGLDWQRLARQHGYSVEEAIRFRDPRSLYQKGIHRYLKLTQPYSKSLIVRTIDRLIDRCAARE